MRTGQDASSSLACALLKLPGELRNKIYSFCGEEKVIHVYWIGTARKPVGSFFALTQVCRQIRAEYRPLYMAQTQHVFHRVDVCKRYVNGLFPLSSSDSFKVQYGGDFTLQISGYEGPDIVMIDLLRFLALSPHVLVKLKPTEDSDTPHPDIFDHLTDFLKKISTVDKFRELILDLDTCLVNIWSYTVQLEFLMSSEQGAKWSDTLSEWWHDWHYSGREVVHNVILHTYDESEGKVPDELWSHRKQQGVQGKITVNFWFQREQQWQRHLNVKQWDMSQLITG
ncbi:hypothetical protein NX059_012076 [Plenodomus lindquistii]|nr:hypothetical protein NX059_012076 [Plenodomus lindquistii]